MRSVLRVKSKVGPKKGSTALLSHCYSVYSGWVDAFHERHFLFGATENVCRMCACFQFWPHSVTSQVLGANTQSTRAQSCRPIILQKVSAPTKIYSTKTICSELRPRKCVSALSRTIQLLSNLRRLLKMRFVWVLLIAFIDWTTGKLIDNHVL